MQVCDTEGFVNSLSIKKQLSEKCMTVTRLLNLNFFVFFVRYSIGEVKLTNGRMARRTDR